MFRVSSFTFDICNSLWFQDAFSKKAVSPSCPPHSEFALTMIASRLEDAFIDLFAKSIFGTTVLSMAVVVKIAFWFLYSTVSTKILFSLSILSLYYLFKVFKITVFSLVTNLLLEVPKVKSRSVVPSMTITSSYIPLGVLPTLTSWSKSSNYLKSLLFDWFLLRVETMLALITQLYLKLQHKQ